MDPLEQLVQERLAASLGRESASDIFSEGINNAIKAASSSLRRDQEEAAMRHSMLMFAQNMQRQPRKKGFLPNVGAALNAVGPSIVDHDQSMERIRSQEIADMERERQVQAQQEERRAQHAYRQAQLDEQKSYHNKLLLARSPGKQAKTGHKETESHEGLEKVLRHAENRIKQIGSKGERSIGTRMINKSWLPTGGDLPLTPEQAEIQTIGDVLKGKLFNAWGYRNQAEFEHVPSVSPDNDVATNLNIIRSLKGMLLDIENMENQGDISSNLNLEAIDLPASLPNFITMFDTQGNEYQIPSNEVNEALNDGLRK